MLIGKRVLSGFNHVVHYGSAVCSDTRKEGPSILLVLKWGGELTPAGRVQAEELGRAFRCMYPGGQGRLLSISLLSLWTHTFVTSCAYFTH